MFSSFLGFSVSLGSLGGVFGSLRGPFGMRLGFQWGSFAGLGRPSVRKSDEKHVFLCVFEPGAFENHVFLCALACLGSHGVPFWSLFGVTLSALGRLGLQSASKDTEKQKTRVFVNFLCVYCKCV